MKAIYSMLRFRHAGNTMNELFPNTIFARLFALVLAALILSNIISAVLFISAGDRNTASEMFSSYDKPPPPPNGQPFDPNHIPPDEGPHTPPNGHPGTGFWIGQIVQFLALSTAAWFGARTIAKPIQHLAHGASQLGDNINCPPMREYGPDETRAAARVFNDMQQRIRRQLDERARFLAAVSHDLRTPLTRMRLRITQLGDDFFAQKFTDDIHEMTDMLDATLSYLRDEVQTERWQMFDVQALVESIAEDALENGYIVPISGTAKPALLQPLALRRCLSNLVINALKYAGNAELKLHDSTQQLIIEVIDHGPGIPENKMILVFEPFIRLDESRNKSTGGVGLGLTIARDMARRNGGELTLHNAAGGGGLIARITLPRRA